MSTETQASAERINLVYRSSSPDGAKDIELPFRLLVLGNYTGDARAEYFGEQNAVQVTQDSLAKVMASLAPSINISVANKLLPVANADELENLSFTFVFSCLEDFNPDNVILQSPVLASLLELRNDLLAMREEGASDTALVDYAKLLEGKDVQGLEGKHEAAQFIRSMGTDAELTLDLLDVCITELEECLSDQLDAILHDPAFLAMEAAWRSLAFVVERTNFDENCIIEILNVTKTALIEDFEDSPELVKSQLYNIVYSKEFGQFGGKPYSCFMGDFTFGAGAADVWLLQQLASIAAMSHAPFLASPSPDLFDVDSFSDLPKLRDLAANFEQPRFAKWNAFRQSEDSRYVGLVLPRFLLRLGYGEGNSIQAFNYSERFNKKCRGVWGNAAFAFVTRLLESFAKTRWCMNVFGAEHGRVEGLRMAGDTATATREKKIPTEVLISDRRETELVNWGFIPLTVHKGEDNATFYSASSVQASPDFAKTEEGRNLAINFQLGAQLPYLYIVCRLSHYIKMMQREHIGSWKKGPEIEQELNNWIRQYVADMDNPAANVIVRRPLRKAQITVSEMDGKGDWYVISLRVVPHLKYMGSQFTLSGIGKLDKH